MRAVRSFGHWLADWRNGATVAFSVLVALVVGVTVEGAAERRQAVQALGAQSAQALSAQRAASRRIDLLTNQLAQLNSAAVGNGQRIGQLVSEVHVLEQQVRRMGGSPVVTEPTVTAATTTTSTTAAPVHATTTTTTVPATTSTTGRASPTTTTAPPRTTTTCVTVPVVALCR